jgi:hypothetical protein
VRIDAILFKITFERCRQYERAELRLPGRFMLGSHSEYSCRTIDAGAGGVAVECEERGSIGDHIVAYIDQLGRIEGEIVRQLENGFAFKILAPPRKHEKLAAQIAWLTQCEIFGVPDCRRHERIAPDDGQTMLITQDGDEYPAMLIDISSRGAAMYVEIAPPIGSRVIVGQTRAHVARRFAGGVAVTFQSASVGQSDLWHAGGSRSPDLFRTRGTGSVELEDRLPGLISVGP